MNLLLLILLGGVTGLASGYLGIGGGIILVPILREMFISQGLSLEIVMTTAFATSLFTGVFTTGASAYRQWKQDNMILWVVPWTAAGALLGGQVGAYFGSNLSGVQLQSAFGIFLILSGIYLSVGSQKSDKKSDPDAKSAKFTMKSGLLILGLATGAIGALLGVGGGIVMVPAFIFIFHFSSGRVAGTSSMVGFLLTISGVIGYLLYGDARAANPTDFWGVVNLSVAIPIAAGSVVTAQIGAKLNKRFGGAVYRRIFGIFMIFVGGRMLLV